MQVRGGKAASVASDVLPKVLPRDLAEEMLARCRSSISQDWPLGFIHALPLATGRRHWETIMTALNDAKGAIVMILISAREVSERLETGSALAHTAEGFGADAEPSPSIPSGTTEEHG